MKPLQWPDQLQVKLQNPKWWDSFPLIGWFYRTNSSLESIKHVAEQLAARPKPPPEVWGDDPARAKLAHYVCKAVKERYEWPNDHFLPDDPFDVVFQIPFDDLQIVEMVLLFEEQLNIKIGDEQAMDWNNKTLGEVVDSLLRKIANVAAAVNTIPH